jgi:UDP-N-acetylmuramoyl-L-alanyl-D-glutamate--2,6-diaminopimelate ligase
MIQKLKNYYHLFIAVIANIYYGFPSRKLTVIGVTGTDGKTTTSSLIYHILNQSGKKVALISTVGAFISGKQYDLPFHVTTPSAIGLQKYIKQVVDDGATYLVLEISSHGLDQFRDWGIHYKVGVLTNLTHEHLDYHKTIQNYGKAKAKLFKKSEFSVINTDPDHNMHYKAVLQRISNRNLITFSLHGNTAYSLKNINFKTNLIGDFNKKNILAAIAVADILGLEPEKTKEAIQTFITPVGRQAVVYKGKFKVIIDFAHTPNALSVFLEAINHERIANKSFKKGRLIHVFGCAGKRDTSKRPLMGEASAKFADTIILTSEDPRGEDIFQINKQIEKGINKIFKAQAEEKRRIDNKGIVFKKRELYEIPDRREAIEFVLR